MANWRTRSGSWTSWWRRPSTTEDAESPPHDTPDALVDDTPHSDVDAVAAPITESFAVVGAGRAAVNGSAGRAAVNGHGAVRLAYATRQEPGPGDGVAAPFTAARVLVANLGQRKDVQLHWRGGDGWNQSALEWQASYGDHEVFASKIPAAAEFAVRYQVDGTEYWDNNGGGNYRLDAPGSSLVGGGVVLRRAELNAIGSSPELVVTGQVYVSDLTYQKQVGIKLSYAPGHWIDVPARYAGLTSEDAYFNVGNAQVWEFTSPPVTPTQDIRIAAYYHLPTQGRTLWDNNFGRDYALPNAPGRVVE